MKSSVWAVKKPTIPVHLHPTKCKHALINIVIMSTVSIHGGEHQLLTRCIEKFLSVAPKIITYRHV